MGSDELGGYLPEDKLEEILEEIAGYEVELEVDPTKPQLGYAYLQRVLAQCRSYLNRVTHYLQITRRYEKNLRRKIQDFELDLDLKLAEKLADDELVRRQPAAQERRALAVSMLKEEHRNLALLKAEFLNLEETVKIIKAKQDSLKRTNGDIRLQRQMVKDDRDVWEGGDEGYTKPQRREDGSVPDGLPPPVSDKKIEAEEVLSGGRPAEPIPEPRDASASSEISAFYGTKVDGSDGGGPPPGPTDEPEEAAVEAAGVVTYEDLLS